MKSAPNKLGIGASSSDTSQVYALINFRFERAVARGFFDSKVAVPRNDDDEPV